jgi:hypothetical protein
MRRRLWLAAASLVFVGWRRLRTLARGSSHEKTGTGIAA